MDRRAFAIRVGGSILAAPLHAEGQRSAPPRRIGVLLVLLSPAGKEAQAFRQGLRDAATLRAATY
jgi:hypothetical protein